MHYFIIAFNSYTFVSDDEVIEGEIEENRLYASDEFNISIEIQEREQNRVKIFMEDIDQNEKTLVFCANQAHALLVRDLINQVKRSKDPNYCVRVTANDGKEGERLLRVFQDNEKSIPTILTTSQKLSTGVNARNVRNIVLLRHIKSIIEFKQIIGRGTRLFDGKDFFTVYDYVEAYKHFSDPEWDGEPLESEPCKHCGNIPCTCAVEPPKLCPLCGQHPCVCPKPPLEPCPECGQVPCVCNRKRKIKIRLADGKERLIQHTMATSFYSPDGKIMSAAEFMTQLYGALPALFSDEAELRKLWGRPDTRRKLLEGLAEKGYSGEQLAELAKCVDAQRSDLYDVLAYVAFSMVPISREERVRKHRSLIFASYSSQQQEFLSFVLEHYVDQGVYELAEEKLPHLIELKYNAVADAVDHLGPVTDIRNLFISFQQFLYEDIAVV